MNNWRPTQSYYVEFKTETNKFKLLWWKITSKVEDWYYEITDFIDYIKRYKST